MQNQNAPGRERTLKSLVELVAALDRRVAHPDRTSETRIADDAARLRAEATLRIEQLRRSAQNPELSTELTRSAAVMTDDGGPATGD